jgi:hypothetical protein
MKGLNMKKLVLTSLVAVCAAGAAHAGVINNNPLYRPEQGQFYSVTSLNSHSESTNQWGLAEDFGYGITDKLMVNLGTDFAERNWFDGNAWDTFSLGLNYRVLDDMNWKADVYGSYALAPVWGDHSAFLDKDMTSYMWTVGLRGGYVANDWTVAGHFAYNYMNSESFNWGDEGMHSLVLGLDGQYLLDENWNLTAGVEYQGYTDDGVKNAGSWTGTFGVNYNFDANTFLGAYISGEMDHYTGDWKVADGFGFGVKFGAQF